MKRKHKARAAYFKDVLYDLYKLFKKYDAAIEFRWVDGVCYAAFFLDEAFTRHHITMGSYDVLDQQSMRSMLQYLPESQKKLRKFMRAFIDFCEEHNLHVTRSGVIYINGVWITSVLQLSPYYLYYEWQHFDVA